MERLQLEVKLPFKPARLQDQTWRLEKLGNLVTYERCIAALQKLASVSTQGTSPLNSFTVIVSSGCLCFAPTCPSLPVMLCPVLAALLAT